jgi:cyclic pyranopterin phosphate synthase
MSDGLTHVDEHGRAQMVDVSAKPVVHRRAVAESFLHAKPSTLDRIMCGEVPKGEPLAVARLAGIQAAKRVDSLIPLCHTLPLDHVEVVFERSSEDAIRVEASVVVTARTGVEMEALTAVSIAALTLWDMTKAIDSDLRIGGIRLLLKEKTPLA